FFFSSRRRHTSFSRDWSSDVCSSDLGRLEPPATGGPEHGREERLPLLSFVGFHATHDTPQSPGCLTRLGDQARSPRWGNGVSYPNFSPPPRISMSSH